MRAFLTSLLVLLFLSGLQSMFYPSNAQDVKEQQTVQGTIPALEDDKEALEAIIDAQAKKDKEDKKDK